MTLGQFFLGIVAIVVATVVYRWQKVIDRETAVLSELRQLYGKYLASSKLIYLSQPYRGIEYSKEELKKFFSITETEIENLSLRDQIFLLAPDDVVAIVDIHDQALRDWKVSFPEHGIGGENGSQLEKEIRQKDETLRAAYQHMKASFQLDVRRHGKFDWKLGRNKKAKP